jgi:hypothetical protein
LKELYKKIKNFNLHKNKKVADYMMFLQGFSDW